MVRGPAVGRTDQNGGAENFRLDECEMLRSFRGAPVKAVSKFVALLLLVLWLPATHHCGLEAIGTEFFSHCDDGGSSCKEVCAKDNCQTVEGVALRKVGFSARIVPPVLVAFASLVVPEPLPAVEPSLAFASARAPELERVVRTWSFVRRAALPARAPGSLA